MSQEDPAAALKKSPFRGWASDTGAPTTLILVRHGVTDHTVKKLFSGGLGGANPPLNEEGREQARAAAEWLAPLSEPIDAVVSSPVRRTRDTADIIAQRLGQTVDEEPGIAEMEFGSWDGMSFLDVHEQRPDELEAWLGSLDTAAGLTGESLTGVQGRVLAGRDRIIEKYAGQSVVVVSHVTPIKVLVADALGAPLTALYRMELAPASVSAISYFMGGPDGSLPMANLRMFNARPTDSPLF